MSEAQTPGPGKDIGAEIQEVSDRLARMLGDRYGFLLCIIPAEARGAMCCMTDLKPEVVRNLIKWIDRKLDADAAAAAKPANGVLH